MKPDPWPLLGQDLGSYANTFADPSAEQPTITLKSVIDASEKIPIPPASALLSILSFNAERRALLANAQARLYERGLRDISKRILGPLFNADLVPSFAWAAAGDWTTRILDIGRPSIGWAAYRFRAAAWQRLGPELRRRRFRGAAHLQLSKGIS